MKRVILRWMALLFCLLLVTALAVPCFADAGDFAGDGDYGGGGDYDGGGDWDWDDDDYGDRSSGGGSGEFSPVVVVFIIVIVVVVVVGNVKSKKGKGSAGYTRVTPKAMPVLQPIANYRNLDPTFQEAQLAQRLANLYVQLQQSWTRKDLSPMRPYLSDPFFSQLNLQLGTLTSRGRTNYVDRIAVLSVNLDGFSQSDGLDHIYATLNTRIVDYTLEDATGKLVSGNQQAEKFMTYRWHLVRPTGQTGDTLGATRAISCPNCGAPLNINETARCPYCDSIVTVAKHDFVLTEIEGISQTTNR